MPDIDVSDLLLDGDIAGESFTVIRRQETVGNNGVTAIAQTNLSAVGSISPTGDNSLVRAEAFQTQANTIKVITNFRLRGPSKDGAGNSFQPDIIQWNGNHFVVRVINEWTSYGAGFVEVECSSIDFIDLAPGEAPAGEGGGLDFTDPNNIVLEPALIH